MVPRALGRPEAKTTPHACHITRRSSFSDELSIAAQTITAAILSLQDAETRSQPPKNVQTQYERISEWLMTMGAEEAT